MKSAFAVVLLASLCAFGCEDKSGVTGATSTDATAADTGAGNPDAAGAVSCEGYCDEVTKACTGANEQYKDKDACVSYCKTLGKPKTGTTGETSGNSVGCREYHASVASKDAASATLHCPHAGPTGANTCGTWCDNYCALVMSNCTAANKLYDTDAACQSECAKFATSGKPGDAAGNTVQCRIYHMGVAGTDAASATTHCPHGKTVSDVCK
jgi:hypothetical protein